VHRGIEELFALDQFFEPPFAFLDAFGAFLLQFFDFVSLAFRRRGVCYHGIS
jgi:hypothetical protein